jgi:glutamine synthetase
MRDAPAPNSTPLDAHHTLSDTGAQYLAGLLAHAPGSTVLCTPTVNGFGRFRPNALAPESVLWGRDNRGALLRVVGQAGDKATRIENRLGEPASNPYLYIASQIYSGLDGLEKKLTPPPATDAPYAAQGQRIPNNLGDALNALKADTAMVTGFGEDFIRYLTQIKLSELQRYDAAEDKLDFQRREYFSRI